MTPADFTQWKKEAAKLFPNNLSGYTISVKGNKVTFTPQSGKDVIVTLPDWPVADDPVDVSAS